MADILGKTVGISVAIYIVAYVLVDAIEAINVSGLTGSNSTLVGTVVPVLAVIGVAMMFIPKKK